MDVRFEENQVSAFFRPARGFLRMLIVTANIGEDNSNVDR
jgi:hypothetical protein